MRQSQFPTQQNRRVAILGRGDTGADCLGTALRQEARSVHQLEILPRPPGNNSHEEGGVREWSVSTTRFTGDGRGNVTKLHAVRVGPPPDFTPVPGTEFTLEVDLVLLAMGFLGPARNGLLEQLGVALDARGNVTTDDNYMTSVPGIFAAGDMRRGQSVVVWAIAEGRRAAGSLDAYLKNEGAGS